MTQRNNEFKCSHDFKFARLKRTKRGWVVKLYECVRCRAKRTDIEERKPQWLKDLEKRRHDENGNKIHSK